jgi:hypothetical protein
LKYWIVVLLIALIVSNGYWFHHTFDNGVSYTYLEASLDSSTQALKQTLQIANGNVIGKSADDVLMLLDPDVSGLKPFEKEGCIYAGQICLALDEARIVVGVR